MSEPTSSCDLPGLGILSDLERDDRAMLASYGTFRFAERGEIIIREGESQNSLYFVISGLLHAKRTSDGREVLVGEIRSGEACGEVNIFDPAAASATVAVMTSAQLWSISRDEFQSFLHGYPVAANALLISIATLLSQRLRALGSRLVDQDDYRALLSHLE